MKRAKASFFIIILFSLLIPAFYQANAARVAVIKELSGDVFVKKGSGTREFKAKDGMSLSEGDSIRTVKKSSANIVYDDGSKTTVAPSTKLTVAKLKNKDAGNQTKVKVVSGKVWNSVKNLSNANDEYDVETPTAVMGVRGTHFLVTTDPITGKSSVAVLDGAVGVSQNSDSGNSAGTANGTTNRPGEQLVTINQTLDTENIHSPIATAKTLDVKQLVQQVEPEVIVEMLQDLTETIQEKHEQALEMNNLFKQTNQLNLLEDTLELAKTASALANIQASVLNEINQASTIKAEVDQLLQSRFNQTLNNLISDNNDLRTNTAATQEQVTATAKEAGMTDAQINNAGPQNVPTGSADPTTGSTGGSSGGGGGNGGGGENQRPSAPIISGEGNQIENNYYIEVSGYDPSAILKLYQYVGDTPSIYRTIDLANNEFNYFTVPYDGNRYYVTQTVNGVESLPSNILTAGEEPTAGLAIVSSNAIEDTNQFTITFNRELDESSVPAPGDFEGKFRRIGGSSSEINFYVKNVEINNNQLVLSLYEDEDGVNEVYIQYPLTFSIKYTKGLTPIKDISGFTLSNQQIEYESTQVIFDQDKNGTFEKPIYFSESGGTQETFEIYSMPYTLNFKARYENNFVRQLSYQVFNGDNPIIEEVISSNDDGVFSLAFDNESLPHNNVNDYSVVLGVGEGSDFRMINSFKINYEDYEAPKIIGMSHTTTPATIQLDFDELIDHDIPHDFVDFELVEIQGTDALGQPIEAELSIGNITIIDNNNKSSMLFELTQPINDFYKLRLAYNWNNMFTDLNGNDIPNPNIKFGQYVMFSLNTPDEMAIYHTPIKVEPYKEPFKVYFQPYFDGSAMNFDSVIGVEATDDYNNILATPTIETDSTGMFFTVDLVKDFSGETGTIIFNVIPNDAYYNDPVFLQSFQVEIPHDISGP